MYINKLWFAIPDDLIGGWAIMNCNKPPGQASFAAGEEQVAWGLCEEDAKHIVQIHNLWLGGVR